MTAPRTHTTAVLWALSGLLLLAYPVVRPWDDETTLAGVVAWDSTAWVLSHTAAILGLMTLAAATVLAVGAGRMRPRAAWLVAAGVALVLPYYGAEAYGLPMIGELARERDDVGVAALADGFRYAAVPVTMFSVGLLVLAVAGIVLVVDTRAGATRAGAVVLGLWLVTFGPQFFLGAPIRIAHGVLALVAGLLLAASVLGGRVRQR